MTILVIPAAGLSTRYGLSRPKFLLQHPLGGSMLQHSITGLGDLENLGITSIRIITLKEFFNDLSVDELISQISTATGKPVIIDLLEKPTSSMVDTLMISLGKIESDESIIVKDCDNLVSFGNFESLPEGNFISYVDLSNFPNVVAHNKSFLKFGEAGTLSNIVEKRIVSSFINIGCIRFNSVSDFLSATIDSSLGREIYVSDVIRILLERGHVFNSLEASNYEDWGTFQEWLGFISTFSTCFVDIDGVVAINENPLGINGGWNNFTPIHENLQVLLEKQKSGRCKIVFTTARTEPYRKSLSRVLEDLGFRNFELIMNLPHAQRILINDFAQTNPYPSAISINIPRNANNLKDYLK